MLHNQLKMYRKVFRRDEKKYLLTRAQYRQLMDCIRPYVEPDEYFQSTICSLYFDTSNHDLIIKSIDKPVFKQKLRIRSYEVPGVGDYVFLEIKIKYRGVVSKRRTKVKLKDFYDYYDALRAGKHPSLAADVPQISRELDYLFRFYHLKPSWVIAYDRKCYRGRDDPGLRITFDQNLRSRSDDLRLEHGDHGVHYFPDDKSVMEIKALDAMPLWLVSTLSKLHIYPASFTKYGKIYEHSKKGVLC